MRQSGPLAPVEQVGRALEARCLRAIQTLEAFAGLLDAWRASLVTEAAVDIDHWRVEYSARWDAPIPLAFAVIADELVHHCRVVVEHVNIYRVRWMRDHRGQTPGWERVEDKGVHYRLRMLDNFSKHDQLPMLGLAHIDTPRVVAMRDGVILGEARAALTDEPMGGGRVFAVLPEIPPAWRSPGIKAALVQEVELVFGRGIHPAVDLTPVLATLGEGLKAVCDVAASFAPGIAFAGN